MISEGSCDTEDWSNDAENPTGMGNHAGLNWSFQQGPVKQIFLV